MAIIKYRCSVCNRLTQLKENERGLTTIGLCTITQGCLGRLIQTDRIEGSIVPALADRVSDIVNRQQRKALYNHTQNIKSSVWVVTHNLESNPVVQVAVEREGVDDLVEIEPTSVELIDQNTTRITFNRNESGVAQFISRSSAVSTTSVSTPAAATTFQLSSSGILTVATITVAANIGINYIVNGVETPAVYPVTYPPVSLSPWSDATTVVLRGREYYVGTINVAVPPVSEAASYYFEDTVYPTDDMFILLALAPFNDVDKIKRQAVFPAGVNASSSLTTFLFNGSEHFVVDSFIESVYPPVFVV